MKALWWRWSRRLPIRLVILVGSVATWEGRADLGEGETLAAFDASVVGVASLSGVSWVGVSLSVASPLTSEPEGLRS